MYRHQVQKGALNGNDFLLSVLRGFLYSPVATDSQQYRQAAGAITPN
jgi:hypothetical protein